MSKNKEYEKQIIILFIRMEMDKRNMDIEKASELAGINTSIMKSVFETSGKLYTNNTLITWAEAIASPSSLYEILERNINRKASYCPKNEFYRNIWNFIANLDNEKNTDS